MIFNKLIYVLVAVLVIATVAIPVCMIDTGKTLAVVVIEGQSNAMYGLSGASGITDMNEDATIPTNRVLYYGDSAPIMYGNWDNPVYDTTFESYGIHSMIKSNHWIVGTEDAAIGWQVARDNHTDVLVINTGISGADIGYLLPTSTGGQYIQTVIDHALADITGYEHIVKAGVVWIQGESDSSTSIDTYKQRFNTILQKNQDLGFEKCYLVQTRPDNGGNASIAQLEICAANPDVILASTAPATFSIANGLLKDDGLHYTGEGRFIVGVDVGEKITVSIPTDGNILWIIPVILLAVVIIGIVSLYPRRE